MTVRYRWGAGFVLLSALAAGCVAEDTAVPQQVAPNFDPVAGRVLLQPAEAISGVNPEPRQPEVIPTPGLKPDGSIVFVRRAP